MTSYYKTIKGKQYDKSMLELADKSVKKKKDGRISITDARKITGVAADSGKITEIEERTLNYIQDNYNFTEPALEYFKNFFTPESKKVSEKTEARVEKETTVPGIKEFLMKYYLPILILILIAILVYINFNKLGFICNQYSEEKSTKIQTEKNNNISESPLQNTSNEYIVKEKDSLIGISQKLFGDYSMWKELYDKNRDIIKNPTIIYPGQKLNTDIK